jgi:hypothetical protein
MINFFKKIFGCNSVKEKADSTKKDLIITLINISTCLTDAQIQSLLPALQTQIDRDFRPIWKTGGTLVLGNKNVVPAADSWVVLIMDNSDQHGALGYHDLTETGLPVSKIFAKDDMMYGLSFSVTLSHELLEMLVDPYTTESVFVQDTNVTGTLYAYEVCDACEDDKFAYDIDGVKVSDFVYPTWFESWRKENSTKFDFCNRITKPFQLLEGGYIGAFTVGPTSSGWQQVTPLDNRLGRRFIAKKYSDLTRFKKRANNILTKK